MVGVLENPRLAGGGEQLREEHHLVVSPPDPHAVREQKRPHLVAPLKDPHVVGKQDAEARLREGALWVATQEELHPPRCSGRAEQARQGILEVLRAGGRVNHTHPVGGRLRHFARRWECLPAVRSVVLEWVRRGVSMRFLRPLGHRRQLGRMFARPRGTPQERAALEQEELKLRAEGVIKKTRLRDLKLGLATFLTPKSSGGWRFILDARPLNHYVTVARFKMESLQTLCGLSRKGDWACKLDLRNAYPHVAVAPSLRPYLGIRTRQGPAEYVGLPFGVSFAPRVFTKVVKPVLALLRSWGIRCTAYLDDLAFLGSSKQEAERNAWWAAALLQWLGFEVNWEKSDLEAKQKLRYLGFVIDLVGQRVTPAKEKLEDVREQLTDLLGRDVVTVRESASLLGRVQALWPAAPRLGLYVKEWQRDQVEAWRRAGEDWDGPCPVSRAIKATVKFLLLSSAPWVVHSFSAFEPKAKLTTDASLRGWGATLELEGRRFEARGFYAEEASVNALELEAVRRALQSFRRLLRGRVTDLLLVSDNTQVVRNVNRQNAGLSLSARMRQLLEEATDLGLRLRAVHLPGLENVTADRLSREEDPSDYMLSRELFKEALTRFNFRPTVDAFASDTNAQMARFWSRWMCPGTAGVDALAQCWTKERVWANPPFVMAMQVLNKVLRDRASALLCLPFWETAAWWPLLQEVRVGEGWELPSGPSTFLQRGQHSLGPPPWRVGVFLVSGSS